MSTAQILVVEDERLVAMSIQNELEQFGYGVSGIASSANEAFEKASQTKPDLVLMDIHLKGSGDGIEAAQQIHARYGIPVVYLSAYSDPDTVARASDTEAFGYLLKPYEERELWTTIEMALAKHRVEQRLEETERWLAAVHDGITDAVVTLDPDDHVRFMNPAAEAMTGWRKEDAIGRPVAQVCNLMEASRAVELDDLVAKVVCQGRAAELPATSWAISRDGHGAPVEGVLSAIHDSHGDLLGTVLTFRSISARLELESLRRQCEERRLASQKMAAMSRLAGGLAQPLNNLLTAILSNTSLALATLPATSDGKDLLERVEVAAQRAAELVQRLMLFSTLSERLTGKLPTVRLDRLIPACLKDIQRRLDPQIALTFKPCSDLWPVVVDELLLGQTLLELAMNSQDAMPQGGQLSLEVENVVLADVDLAEHPNRQIGEFVRVRISDTGSGMKPTVRARALEPCLTTKESGKVAGLGLMFVTAFVEQQHGWVEFVSRANQGTRFDLYFPRHGVEAASGAVAQADNPRGGTPTILLCDADPMVRDVGRRILEAEGYRVLLAENGAQAIAAFRQEKDQVALAILDLNMSRLSAYEVLERLIDLDPGVRVLFSGGYFAEDLSDSSGHTLGVIAKPYSHDDLVDAVGRALARQSKDKLGTHGASG